MTMLVGMQLKKRRSTSHFAENSSSRWQCFVGMYPHHWREPFYNPTRQCSGGGSDGHIYQGMNWLALCRRSDDDDER